MRATFVIHFKLKFLKTLPVCSLARVFDMILLLTDFVQGIDI